MNSETKLRQRIIEGTIRIYKKLGPKFTMNDLATELGMSKKTIYTVFSDKESLLFAMVDFFFDSIKESENEVLHDPAYPIAERFRRVLGVMPESTEGLDFTQIYIVQEKYPRVYRRVQERLESGWEKTLEILDRGVEEGIFRDVNKTVFQLAFEASVERFLMGNELETNHIEYTKALQELVHILVDGITVENV